MSPAGGGALTDLVEHQLAGAVDQVAQHDRVALVLAADGHHQHVVLVVVGDVVERQPLTIGLSPTSRASTTMARSSPRHSALSRSVGLVQSMRW
jgi:hypothetical protein